MLEMEDLKTFEVKICLAKYDIFAIEYKFYVLLACLEGIRVIKFKIPSLITRQLPWSWLI